MARKTQQVAAGMSNVGRARKHNEDAFLVDTELGLYVVCDGVGGRPAGEIASATACQSIRRVVREWSKTLDAYARQPTLSNRAAAIDVIELAVESAWRDLLQVGESDPAKKGLSTTAVVLLLVGNSALVANVGDSRVYICRNGEQHQITRDHSITRERLRRGMITQQQAEQTRKDGKLFRALGMNDFVQVDSLHVELAPNDTFLLCSDGLSDYITGTEFSDMCKQYDAADLPARLVDMANERGGHDNITAVVAHIDGYTPTADDVDAARKAEALKAIPLFKDLEFDEISRVLNIARVVPFDEGEQIIRDGDDGCELYVVLSGMAEVRKAGIALSRLKPGGFFGEMSLVDRQPRSADIFATKKSKFMAIAGDRFEQLLAEHPSMGVKLLKAFCEAMSRRLRRTSSRWSGEIGGEVATTRGGE